MRVDPLDFHWLEKPDSVALQAAVEELSLLGALDHRQNLTPLGHLISDLQIDPGIAHMIYYSCCKGLGMSRLNMKVVSNSNFCHI
jgi:HrpA-like RNA helicase